MSKRERIATLKRYIEQVVAKADVSDLLHEGDGNAITVDRDNEGRIVVILRSYDRTERWRRTTAGSWFLAATERLS